jgi:hypothetical protein
VSLQLSPHFCSTSSNRGPCTLTNGPYNLIGPTSKRRLQWRLLHATLRSMHIVAPINADRGMGMTQVKGFYIIAHRSPGISLFRPSYATFMLFIYSYGPKPRTSSIISFHTLSIYALDRLFKQSKATHMRMNNVWPYRNVLPFRSSSGWWGDASRDPPLDPPLHDSYAVGGESYRIVSLSHRHRIYMHHRIDWTREL